MIEDYFSLLKNNAYNLVSLPKVHKLHHCQWIIETIYVVYGSVDKHKVRHVVKGLLQVK